MDAPDTLTADPKPQPTITNPQMDTNQIYQQEHERPQQVSDDQPIQLAQNEPPQVGPSTHDIVRAPDGARVAFPKGTDPTTVHAEMSKWWQPHLQRTRVAWDSLRNAASNAAQAIGLPADMPEWQATSDNFVRDPIGATGNVIGALVGGLAHGVNAVIPSTPENKAMVVRAQSEFAQGNHLAAAVTLTPLVGDGLAKAVKQAQSRDYSGALGTSLGVAAPFLTDSFKAEGELPITREKPVQPTTTSYEHTPAQNGQFGNYEHVVTTKNAEGHTVGHLAAQDTAPGEVTIRSNQIYDEAHRGQGKGTAAIRTLVNETAKNPDLKVIHSDITTTGAARGAWEKIADANPDTVTKQDFNGVPRWSVDLDKVREKAANAPEFNGEERRGAARGPLMKATDIENNLKTGQPVITPFDNTTGAMDTINRDIESRLAKPAAAQTVGTAKGAVDDTALFNKAKEELGAGASISDIARRAQAMKIAGIQTPEELPKPSLEVKHWSKGGVPLTETNPEKFGTGRAGAEKSRANEEGFVPRTYFGMEGYKEPAVQSGLEHKASLDSNAYYDKDADPHGIWKDNFKPSDKASAATNAERAVKEAGYSGYYSPEQQVLASFNKVPVRVSELQDAANAFNKSEGRPPIEHKEVGPSKYAKRIADEYDKLQHNPSDPEVQKAYGAMKNDIDKQWDFATKNMGVKFEPWNKEGQPYANSKEMVADVKNNRHLYFFQGGEMPSDHPLAEAAGQGLTYNDKLRAIHDLFGHAVHGNQFGPAGEERAWQEHLQMFSPDAMPAVTTETRGQNSWVNFGKHLRNAAGDVPGKDEAGFVPATKRPFAEQKAGLLPEWATRPEGAPAVKATEPVARRSSQPSTASQPQPETSDLEQTISKTLHGLSNSYKNTKSSRPQGEELERSIVQVLNGMSSKLSRPGQK